MPLPANENVAKGMVQWLLADPTRLGIAKTVEEVMPIYRDLMDDPEGDKLIRRMDQANIDVTVIFSTDNLDRGLDNESMMRRNEECSQIASKYHGCIIALASVDPRRTEAPALFRRCITEFKMKGLKWHPDMGYYPDSPEAYKVLKVADELGVPVLTHCAPLAVTRARYAHPILDVALTSPI
jgi:predicted TIM-barrel fold metal-dependent hydrolase